MGARLSIILGTATAFPAGTPFHIGTAWGDRRNGSTPNVDVEVETRTPESAFTP